MDRDQTINLANPKNIKRLASEPILKNHLQSTPVIKASHGLQTVSAVNRCKRDLLMGRLRSGRRGYSSRNLHGNVNTKEL